MVATVGSRRIGRVPAPIEAPQSPQNFAPAGEKLPQAGQAAGKAVPQEVQNRLPPIVPPRRSQGRSWTFRMCRCERREVREQRLRVQQILGVETLGEPAIDWGK